MRRTEQLQGLRLMKFEDVYGRCYRGDLSQAEASEILGMSERTFRRWRERYEAEGAEGLYDRRLGRVSARRAPVDEVMRVLELFETRYPDFTAKHFHEKLVCEHGFGLSYNWLRLSLQAHGKIKPAPRRGAHRRKRPRRPVGGMMLHQDGSSHEWVAGQWWDLIVTMDDATSEVYSGFFVAEEGTMSTFRGLGEVIAENGLFCSLYADRASHYWHTPEAGGGVDKDNPTQVGRALAQLGIELIAPIRRRPGAARSACSGPCRSGPRSCASAGIATMAEANRFLEELFWPAHNARFTRPAADTGSAFVAFAGNATRNAADRSPPPPLRQGAGPGARISRRPPGRLPRTQVSGALPRRRRNHRRRQAPGRVTRFDATEPNHHNRRGQFIWYIKRSTQFVIDTHQCRALTDMELM